MTTTANYLKGLIYKSLSPFTDHDYIYLDCPYHQNIGDILIWEGTEYFLRDIPHRCLYKASKDTFKAPKISSDVTIFMHGGGNFGDVWPHHHEFRMKILEMYPDNRIVFLPQTVFYNDENQLKIDAERMARHKNLTVCARDKVSYDILKKYVKNTLLLVPDMAFCINTERLKAHQIPERDVDLLLVRYDHERADINYEEHIDSQRITEREDWPSYKHRGFIVWLFLKMLMLKSIIPSSLIDWYANRWLRPSLVKRGVAFISQYKNIFTTRLHVAILSVLLGKNFTFFDNNYGKNSAYYNTWLADTDGIIMKGGRI